MAKHNTNPMAIARGERTVCGDCAASNPTDVERCWVCDRTLGGGDARAEGRSRPVHRIGVVSTSRFSLQTLLLAVLLISACFAAARVWAELGIMMALLGGLAYLRTALIVDARTTHGVRIPLSQRVVLFAQSVFVVWLTLVGIGGVLLASGLLLGLAMLLAGVSLSTPGSASLLAWGLVLVFAATTITALFLMRSFWLDAWSESRSNSETR